MFGKIEAAEKGGQTDGDINQGHHDRSAPAVLKHEKGKQEKQCSKNKGRKEESFQKGNRISFHGTESSGGITIGYLFICFFIGKYLFAVSNKRKLLAMCGGTR